jgi:hypothetical protein
MKKIATPHFDFKSKKEYQKPTMNAVQLQLHTLLGQASPPPTLSGKKGEDPESDIWYDLD